MQRIIEESTEDGVQTISNVEVCKKVLGSRSALVSNPKSLAPAIIDDSYAYEKEERIKKIDELTEKYAKMAEQNEKLMSQLAMWEDRWTDVQKLLGQGHGGDGSSTS